MIVPLSSGWYFVYIICMNPYQKIELKILVLLPNGQGRGGVLDTRTKGWGEAGRNRDGAMEGFGLKFC